jgi:hypothetical protein
MLRWYSKVMFGPYAVPYIDNLYFWPPNVDPRVGRAMMSRNFSNISVGVIRQMTTAFSPQGLTSADGRMVYAGGWALGRAVASERMWRAAPSNVLGMRPDCLVI